MQAPYSISTKPLYNHDPMNKQFSCDVLEMQPGHILEVLKPCGPERNDMDSKHSLKEHQMTFMICESDRFGKKEVARRPNIVWKKDRIKSCFEVFRNQIEIDRWCEKSVAFVGN